MKQLKKLPEFKNEDEERAFWTTHTFLDYYDIKQFTRVPPLMEERTLSVIVPAEMDNEVQRLSRERKISVEAMVRQLLAAGLKQQRLQPGA
jgi:hypothetical protein